MSTVIFINLVQLFYILTESPTSPPLQLLFLPPIRSSSFCVQKGDINKGWLIKLL